MKGRMSIMTRLWTHPSFSSSNHREPCVCRRSDLRSGRAEGMSLMSVMQHAGQSHNSHFSEGKLHRAFFSINPWRTADAALRDEPTGHGLSSAQKHTHTRWQNTKKKGALHEYLTRAERHSRPRSVSCIILYSFTLACYSSAFYQWHENTGTHSSQ